MGQGLAWACSRLNLSCTVIVPDHAPETKLSGMRRLNVQIIKVPFDKWWEILETHDPSSIYPRAKEESVAFVHPVCSPYVLAGNGTIGAEIIEDLPDVSTIIVPYGGGALSCGIASAVKALRGNDKTIRVIAAEVETAAPLKASLEAGEPKEVEYKESFVDGIGGKSVLKEMWPLVREVLDGSESVSLGEVAQAIKVMVERNRIVAEGAGGVAVAVALKRAKEKKDQGEKVVCVVSGGGLDTKKLLTILKGEIPS